MVDFALEAVAGRWHPRRGNVMKFDTGCVLGKTAAAMPLSTAAAGVRRGSEPNNARDGSAVGTGAILVVDDDTAVREIVAEFLTEAGFSVLQADGGRAALRMLSETPDIRMMISDIRMPDMSGIELAEAAVRVRKVRVILMSGYFQPQPIRQRFLRKPFRMRDLQAAVEAELLA